MSCTASFTLTTAAGSHVGISPLKVMANGLASTSTLYTGSSTNQFRKNLYFTDWDDPSSGNYGFGLQEPRNETWGALGGKVYEVTGGDQTFTPIHYMTDGVSVDSVSANTITVYDPIGANGWTSIYAVNNVGDADFSLAPAGATHQNTNSMATVRGYATSGRCVLLKRGGAWDVASNSFSNASNWQIGAYGSGAKPIVQATANGVTLMPFANSGGPYTNIIWSDLTLTANGHTNVYIAQEQNGTPSGDTFQYRQHLMLRLTGDANVSGTGSGLFMSHPLNLFIVDCDFTSWTYVVMGNGNGNLGPYDACFLGTSFRMMTTDNNSGHTLRITGCINFVLTGCDIRGACQTDTHLKLHAQIGTVSQWIIISGNKWLGRTGSPGSGENIWTCVLGPTDGASDERVADFIIERNWFLGNGITKQHVTTEGSRGTVRNNLYDMSNANSSDNSIGHAIGHAGAEPMTDDVESYNNTGYSSLTNTLNSDGQGFYLVYLFGGAVTGGTNLYAKNNYGSAPNFTRKFAIYDPNNRFGSNASNNTLTNTPSWVTSNGVGSGTLSAPADFKLLSSSAARGAGTSVSVLSDFFDVYRPQGATYDQGFAEYNEGTGFPWESSTSGATSFIGSGAASLGGGAIALGAAFAAGSGA